MMSTPIATKIERCQSPPVAIIQPRNVAAAIRCTTGA